MPTVDKLLKTTSLIVVIFLGTYCSKIFHPESSEGITKNISEDRSYLHSSDSKELKNFFAGGVQKPVSNSGTSSKEILKTARSYLGVPHCMGGSSKKCADCSGFVLAVFRAHSISLPHNSEEQARYGKIIRDKEKLVEGDLVFFIESYSTRRYITHSGIYVGNNEFIHTSSKKGVMISPLDNIYWKDKFIFGTRVLEE